MKNELVRTLLLVATWVILAFGQERPLRYDAASIQLQIEKLKVLGSALYIAAHPDDENTALLAYLANERLVRTAYLSLTRGEGGQNLIGSEKGAALGVLRTRELLAARQIDGAEQFFGGAEDFGYSKTPGETLDKWDRETILANMVGIIRSFRPDVIITRFSSSQGGHGHHLASAILALDAFGAAADPDRFPEQLDTTAVWQAKRIVWNTWRPDSENRNPDLPPVLSIDLGIFNPLLGKSYTELAAESRSMHKSQGFGSAPVIGSYINYFEHTAGQPAQHDLFDDIDITWKRAAGGQTIGVLISALADRFEPAQPSASIPALLEIHKRISALPDSYWRSRKLFETERLIQMCAGLWLDARANDYAFGAGDSITIETRLVNRSGFPARINRISIDDFAYDTLLAADLKLNTPFEMTSRHRIPGNGFQKIETRFTLLFDSVQIRYVRPVRYYWTDRVKGELSRTVSILPALTTVATPPVLFFSDTSVRETGIIIKNWTDSIRTMVSFQAPDGWRVEPYETHTVIGEKYGETHVPLRIFPPENATSGKLIIRAGTPLRRSETIDYDHIPAQIYLSTGGIDLVRAPLKIIPLHIGYIMGSGDDIPSDLRQVGYTVTELSDMDIEQEELDNFDVLIAGTRAYNTRAKLHLFKDKLMRYIENGGTYIVLHNTRFGLQPDDIGPYPFTVGRDRVSVEDAPVAILHPGHRLLSFPNRITPSDFDGWVQERGLYFASEWDPRYQTIISSHDPGESPLEGGILYTPFGKGHYIYAAYSWFRQLPAGIPGAYKLFINLITVGADNEQ